MAFNPWNIPEFDLYDFLRCGMFLFDPEKAHALVISALQIGLGPREACEESDPILKTKLFGLDFENPVGLSAGFDRDAEAINGILNIGFGFAEFGCVTPLPQAGNPKPRIFRIPEASSIIVRMGAPNGGIENFARHVQKWANSSDRVRRPVGANLGANKNSEDAIEDRIKSLKRVYPFIDYMTVSLSRPNAKGNYETLPKQEMSDLISKMTKARDEIAPTVRLFMKMSPDADEEQQECIATLVVDSGVQALIIGGTSSIRPSNVPRKLVDETGGLSGPPIFGLSTRLLSNMYKRTKGKVPLIGSGGVISGADAYEKIRSGASLIQLYSALIFKGPGIVPRINKELAELLKKDGFNSVSEAVGANHKK